jgi:hypothetical protein
MQSPGEFYFWSIALDMADKLSLTLLSQLMGHENIIQKS